MSLLLSQSLSMLKFSYVGGGADFGGKRTSVLFSLRQEFNKETKITRQVLNSLEAQYVQRKQSSDLLRAGEMLHTQRRVVGIPVSEGYAIGAV